MKSLNGVAVAAAWSVLALGGIAHAQEAVQWRVEDGGNGHWYADAQCSGTWPDSRDFAVSVGGYLATLVSPPEHTFVTTHIPLIEGYWIGGYQDVSAPDFAEPAGGWRWVSGEAFRWAAWGSGQPDNYAGDQRYLRLAHSSIDDLGEAHACGILVSHLLIEYSADCNGDWIVDYGQILDGTFEDANGNGVPDCCDEGVDCDPCLGDVN
ncbi:MAG: hypothetical protein ACO4BU_03175, partial [Phycisphaerales bacterium]